MGSDYERLGFRFDRLSRIMVRVGENLSGAMPVGGLQVWSMVRAGLS